MKRAYICLTTKYITTKDITTKDKYCFILNSDLGTCASFKIDPKLEVWRSVFTKSRGLVLAGSDGQIVIRTFDEWTPNPPIKAVRPLTGQIEALSTRGGLIIAGSGTGEVGGWNYDGVKLYQIQLPEVKNCCVRSISIGPNNFVVGRNNAIYEIPTRSPLSTPTTPHKIKHIPKDGLEWASYDIEGNYARRRLVLSKPGTALDTYRPVLPRYESQHITYLLSLCRESCEIVLHNFKDFKYICRYQVDKKLSDNIKFMWCTHTQLFLIDCKGTIYMKDFAKGQAGSCSFKIAECFALDMFG